MLAVRQLDAQRSAVSVVGDNVTIRGCISQVNPQTSTPPTILVWSRSDIMLAGATGFDAGTADVGSRVLYWLEDDENLSKYLGQMVEVKGELDDFEKGQIEINRDGAFTEIELDLGGKEEKVRVPTAWLGPTAREDQEFEIMARRVDVEDVNVIGPCR
jgi:hypothetical protein